MGSKVSAYGDIYSYGILLLEIFTGKRPTDVMFGEGLNLHSFVKTALPEQVMQIVDPILLQIRFNGDAITNHNHDFSSVRKTIILKCLISIFEIGISCSLELPQERINMGDVVAQLCSIRTKLLRTNT
jgi:serine/threonine protein kinase